MRCFICPELYIHFIGLYFTLRIIPFFVGVQFLDICNNKSLTVRQAGSSIAQGVWIDKKLCLTLDEEDWNDKSLLLGGLFTALAARILIITICLHNNILHK